MKKISTKFFLLFLCLSIILFLLSYYISTYINKTLPQKKYNAEASDIIKLLKDKNKNNSHPRLMATYTDFKRIKSQISQNKLIKEQYKYIKSRADLMLHEKPVKYELSDNTRLLFVSRKVLDRIQTLSFVYRISGEKKYADRAWLELQTISDANPDRKNFSFPDWHPSHFLDTAEMTNAAAIGYDWLYDYLSSEQKSIVRSAILTKGLNQALNFYHNQKEWVVNSSNWNGVCNSGIGLGALAIADESKEYELVSGEILENAIKSLPTMLTQYNPNGGWYEGPNYWDYGITYSAYFISALDSALGTDYELSKSSGFSSAGDFPIFMTGTNGTFNFADAESPKLKSPVMLWLANKFKNSNYVWYYNKEASVKNSSIMSLIWYDKRIKESKPKIQDKYFREIEVATLHSSLLESNDSFVGFKAGKNNLAHSDLDIGTFVYDSLGVRWFCDLGSENYNVPGYWNMGINGRRWQYYRKRAEGHNTLVINPGLKPDQNVYANTKIELFKSDTKRSFAIADITDAYKKDALSVKRGVILFKNSGQMLVQDEISTNKPSDIWWFAHTPAIIKISSDKKSALLLKDGKTLKISILSPVEANFNKMEAKSLPSSPTPANQTYNAVQKLYIHLNNAQNTTISIIMSPITPSKTEPLRLPKVIKLKDWNIIN
ncbi:hypothetical protein CPJCM30710_29190 [Clostridium polyendosporum]|uniref:Heparinase II/III-like protein n=1 Tax=Clostridium polyendosporum TaxID=69208 RepID=A0A919S2Y1_9CLOT|nr:heparinase II/III family protein [Clostridium polyendosporum]GIM30253.1 hypothetical protein CPJCM30710_29190 [Clostridium polyendosporum]